MNDSKNCSSSKCMKTCLLSVIAVIIFTFVYDWLVHGFALKALYLGSAQAFRTVPEMEAMMPYCIAFHVLMAIVVTCFFKNYKNYSPEACAADPELAKKCTPCARGICFGVHLGLIFGLGMFASYIMFPVSLELAIAWFFTGLLKGVGIGLVLSCLCKKKEA